MEKLVILAVVIFALLIATGPPTEPAVLEPLPARPRHGPAGQDEDVTLAGIELKGRCVFPTTFVLAALLGSVSGGVAAVRLSTDSVLRPSDVIEEN